MAAIASLAFTQFFLSQGKLTLVVVETNLLSSGQRI
jgi:hypothetical protein